MFFLYMEMWTQFALYWTAKVYNNNFITKENSPKTQKTAKKHPILYIFLIFSPLFDPLRRKYREADDRNRYPYRDRRACGNVAVRNRQRRQ